MHLCLPVVIDMCDSPDRANKLADCCLRTYATDYITGMCEEMYLVQMIICIAQVTIFAGNVYVALMVARMLILVR